MPFVLQLRSKVFRNDYLIIVFSMKDDGDSRTESLEKAFFFFVL